MTVLKTPLERDLSEKLNYSPSSLGMLMVIYGLNNGWSWISQTVSGFDFDAEGKNAAAIDTLGEFHISDINTNSCIIHEKIGEKYSKTFSLCWLWT